MEVPQKIKESYHITEEPHKWVSIKRIEMRILKKH
jgi:hypothetical protein